MAGYINIASGAIIENITPEQFVQAGLIAQEWADLDEHNARQWRNSELYRTDPIVAIQDHSKRASFIAYRQLLRDWPATASFPNTRPVRT